MVNTLIDLEPHPGLRLRPREQGGGAGDQIAEIQRSARGFQRFETVKHGKRHAHEISEIDMGLEGQNAILLGLQPKPDIGKLVSDLASK